MTNQTIPADKVRPILDEWERIKEYADWEDMDNLVQDVRALLPTPPLPTLADMTVEERLACKWMQADVKNRSVRYVIANPLDDDDEVALIDADGDICWLSPERVTPRQDLPRMEWPGDQKPAPTGHALPEGFRLADHPEHGRVIVTTPEPDDSGDVEFACHAPEGIRGGWFGECLPEELTFLDGANYRALAERNDEKVC